MVKNKYVLDLFEIMFKNRLEKNFKNEIEIIEYYIDYQIKDELDNNINIFINNLISDIDSHLYNLLANKNYLQN